MRKILFIIISAILGSIWLFKMLYEMITQTSNGTKVTEFLMKVFLMICLVIPFGFFILMLVAAQRTRKLKNRMA